jgi:hypothetical protein
MRTLVLPVLLLVWVPTVHGQWRDAPGVVSLGLRSSASLFNGGERGSTGMGTGGQFRIRITERVNTDWFYDFLRSDVGTFAHRTDQHIGWSVLYYLTDPGKGARVLQPYVLAGHCFDHTRLMANLDRSTERSRFSSAVQAGVGTHVNLSDRSDLSLVGQYMVHLGSDVHAHQDELGRVYFEQHGAGLEGHLLFHLSYNYKLFRAW